MTANRNTEPMRLAKYLANAGIASRRKCEELIADGRVTVNGKIIITPAFNVTPVQDTVCYEGKKVEQSTLQYYVFNKPAGYICSAKDQHAKHLIYDLLPEYMHSMFYVGRLDKDTEGLLILTNDGDLAQGITHPSHEIEKHYIAECAGEFTQRIADRMLDGIVDDGEFLHAKKVELIKQREESAIVEIVLTEGRKREVRRICAATGFDVIRLARISVGNIRLGRLAAAQYRPMTDEEIIGLKKLIYGSDTNGK